jgi:nicotinamidase-related amidase
MRNILISIPIILVIIIGIFALNIMLYKRNVNSVSLGTEIKTELMDKPALLVMGIQEGTTGVLSDNDFYKASSWSLIRNINRLIDSTSKYNIPVIYVRHEVSNLLINLINSKLAQGSPGIVMDKRLKKVPGYLFLNDKMDAFGNTTLDSLLLSRGINKLYFAGLDPAYSIGNTMEAARNRNYRVGLISDAVISESLSLKTRKIREFSDMGCEVLSGEAYIKKLPDSAQSR